MSENPPWIRLRDAYPLIGRIIKAAIEECALTVQVLPEELLSNREMLTHYLTEQLRNLTARKARELQENRELA
jgi:hypothetical protein